MATQTASLDAASIAAIGKVVGDAVAKSSGTRSYNPVQNQVGKNDSPASRVETMRSYKISQDNNQILSELVRQQKNTTRTMEDLDRLLNINNRTLSTAINTYKDLNKAEEQLVKALQEQLKASRITADEIKMLGGEIKTLEDALRFADMAKATTHLSQAMKQAEKGQKTAMTMLGELTALKKNGPLTGEFKALHDDIMKILKDNKTTYNEKTGRIGDSRGKQLDRDLQEIAVEVLNERMQDLFKSGKLKGASVAVDDLAVRAQKAGIEANIKAMKSENTVREEAVKRLKDWTAKTASSANVVVQLTSAMKYLYNTMKVSAATGTERSITGVIGREFSSAFSGVSTDAVQQVSAANARNRTALGRGTYDSAVKGGIGDMFKITGDSNEALKQFAASVGTMMNSGVQGQDAIKATKGLIGTFNELQYITGMTAEQINQMNQELTAGADFRQSMNGLDSKQRAAAIENLDLMMKENLLRGNSIEQSKQMIQAQKDIANPFSPQARMRNAAKLRQLGGVVGIDMTDASEQTRLGGAEKYRASLMAQGYSKEEADRRVKNANDSFQTAGTRISGVLAGADGKAMQYESLGKSLSDLKPLFDGTFDQSANSPNKVMGTAAKDFREGVDKFLAGTGMRAIDGAKNIGSSMLGTLGGALGLYGLSKTGIFGKGMAMAKNAFGGSGGGILSAGKAAAGSLVSNGAGFIASNGGKLLSVGKAAAGGVGGVIAGTTLDWAGDKLAAGGHDQLGAGAKVLGSTASWGATGAAIGSVVPIVGTALGAGIGALGGAAYGLYDNWNGLAGSPSTSKTAAIDSAVNSASSAGRTVDPGSQMVQLLAQVNQKLAILVDATNAQNEAIASASDKNIEMLKRGHRSMKQNTFSADTVPAAATLG